MERLFRVNSVRRKGSDMDGSPNEGARSAGDEAWTIEASTSAVSWPATISGAFVAASASVAFGSGLGLAGRVVHRASRSAAVASGKEQIIKAYMLFLAHWARKLS